MSNDNMSRNAEHYVDPTPLRSHAQHLPGRVPEGSRQA